MHSLASAEPKAQTELRLMSRSNEQLATKLTDANGFAHFEAGLTRGEGGLEPAAIIATPRPAITPFSASKRAAFDLSDRGVAGRPVPVGLDAFVYTERGVYRSGETVNVTTLLRDVRGKAAPGAGLTLVMERPDGVEYRRALIADQGLGGRGWTVPLVSSAMSGTWRVRAFTDPKRPAVGEASFMVEDYVADRLEFALTSGRQGDAAQRRRRVYRRRSFPLRRADLGSRADRQCDDRRRQGAPGFPGYAFGLADDDVTAVRQDLDDLPHTDARRQSQASPSRSTRCRRPRDRWRRQSP